MMFDTLLAKIWTPYVRNYCGSIYPVFLTIEKDEPGVYCRLVSYEPWRIVANLHVENFFIESANEYTESKHGYFSQYVQDEVIWCRGGGWEAITASQKARTRDVRLLSPYASFINSFFG
jgi:hypothetical protein